MCICTFDSCFLLGILVCVTLESNLCLCLKENESVENFVIYAVIFEQITGASHTMPSFGIFLSGM